MGRNTLSDKQRGWLGHVEACTLSGGSMKAYAEAHGLDLQQFYFWKGRLKKSGLVDAMQEGGSAEPVRVSPGAPRPMGGKTCIQLANGISIEVPGDFNAATLTELLDVALRLS
jgi:hypothetical protein